MRMDHSSGVASRNFSITADSSAAPAAQTQSVTRGRNNKERNDIFINGKVGFSGGGSICNRKHGKSTTRRGRNPDRTAKMPRATRICMLGHPGYSRFLAEG